MLWSIVSAASTGILLGLRLRVPSVLAASFLVAVASAVFLPLLIEWSLLTGMTFVFVLLAALQFRYLAGALIASGHKRTRSQAHSSCRRHPAGGTRDHSRLSRLVASPRRYPM